MAFGEVATIVADTGHDPSGLGHWCWTLFQGKDNVRTRVVVAYRPVDNRRNLGSAYNQHSRYFRAQHDETCPRDAFVWDLGAQLHLSRMGHFLCPLQ